MARIAKKPVKLRFAIAETTEDNPQTVYSDWQTDWATETDPSGRAYYNEYGTELDFDKIFTFEANNITRRIDKSTIIVSDHYYLGNYGEKGDYRVKYKFPEAKNYIVIGCNAVEEVNNPKIYFIGDAGTILAFQMDYNYETLKGYVPVDTYIPFNEQSTIWHKYTPASIDQTKNRIRYIGSTKVGLDDSCKDFLELQFEEVVEE